MTECKDTIESRNASSLRPTTGFAYSPTIQLYQLDALRADFEKNAFYIPSNTNAGTTLNEFIDLYSQETFNVAIISFNNFLLSANRNDNLNISQNYPFVKERLDRGVAITPIEFAAFMNDSGYNPYSIQISQASTPKTVLKNYNYSLSGSFSKSTMGSFCELAPSIFGAVAGFFTAIQGFANKITDIINSIKNFSLASLLDNLKSKIINVIDSAIQKVKSIIENFSMDGLISQTNQYFHNKVLAKFNVLKNKAMSFFDPTNIENFKKKIEGLVSYAANIFKNPSAEEIQFLIYRFCSFITQVENLINGIKNPLEDFNNRYVYAGRILGSNSSINTINAVSAGAKRFNSDETAAAIASGVSAESIRGNQPAPTSEEYKNLPPWNEGKGDSRVTFRGNWVKPKEQGGMGEEGWNAPFPANLDAKVYLMRVYNEFSRRTGVRQIIINSAYRSSEYNERIRQAGGGAAPNSMHIKGIAFDVTWSGYPRYRDEFIAVARSYGFNGVGVYGSFTHIDKRETFTQWSG
jgi:hypothetical protein